MAGASTFQVLFMSKPNSSSSATATFITSNAPGQFSSATHNHGTLSIGTAAADRYVLVAITANGSSTANLTSVTIGGVSATLYQNTTIGSGGSFCISAFAVLLVTTGTTANITLNYSGSFSRSAIGIYNLNGLGSSTPVDHSSDSTASASTLSLTLNSTAGGVILGVFSNRTTSGSTTVTWTGATEDYDTNVWGGLSVYVASSSHGSTASSTQNITVSPTMTDPVQCMSAISFG